MCATFERGGDGFTNEGLKRAVQVPQVYSISLSRCAVTDGGLALLRHSKSVRRVSLSGDQFTGDGIRKLRDAATLSSLSIYTPVDFEVFQALTDVPQLDRIYLSKMELYPGFAEDVNRLTNLRSASISVEAVDDEQMQWLAGIKLRIRLGLDECKQISEAGWMHLNDSSITDLSLERCELTDDDLVPIGKLERLESLTIRLRQDHRPRPAAFAKLEVALVARSERGESHGRRTSGVEKGVAKTWKLRCGIAVLRWPGRLCQCSNASRTQKVPTGKKNAHIRSNLTPVDALELRKEPKLDTVFLTGGKATNADLQLVRIAPDERAGD